MRVQFLPVSFGFQFKGLNIVLTQKIFLVVKIKLSVQFRLPCWGRSISLWRKEGTTAYRLEYAHVLNYTIDIEYCQFIHNSPMANFITTLDNNKKWCIIITKDIVSKATGFTKKA